MIKRTADANPLRMVCVDTRSRSFYGAQRSLCALVAHMDVRRVAPIVLTAEEGALSRGFRDAGVDVRVLPVGATLNVFGGQVLRYPLWRKVLLLGSVATFTARLLAFLRRERIDVVYANDLRSLLLVAPAARILRLPLIWYVREAARLGRFQALGLRLATRVVLVSDGVARAFTLAERERYADKFVTIRTGFDFSALRPGPGVRARVRAELGLPLEARVVGLVGSICPNKGHDVLVEAVPTILQACPDACFLVVGSAPKEQREFEMAVRRRAEMLGVDHAILWLGYSPNVPAIYSSLDALVLPSRSEGLPRAVIEGLGAGLPVVASDVGGTREIITEAVHGLLLSEVSPHELANAVKEVLGRPDGPAERARRIASMESRFAMKPYVDAFTRLAESVVGRQEGQPC